LAQFNIQRRRTGIAGFYFAIQRSGKGESRYCRKIEWTWELLNRESGEKKVIVFNHGGHGHLDLAACDAFLSDKLTDYEYPDEKVRNLWLRLG
jgi:hypothetical protein